ncbi:uncharacterized protein BT62DRAFT_1079752 [Guyanagaster necrorhizus]|uniref:Uncharacterized protein n=1 Tax=Guyanagaster necrorhizus TaxID=856835 RepID=A0A9P7VIP3_9AGAR|nr:uncharacterized protein BT62DRAFT_1079752 [Guyanagaster necrorhizus MCA 3950]KAG7441796.1 hypothetical protein BT62DRAFT_1079752 [Guyanagaster necrorhizus MCA 3950]
MEEEEPEKVKFLPSSSSQEESSSLINSDLSPPRSSSMLPSSTGIARLGNTLWMIIGLLIVAAATATLHHLFLSFLHGREVQQQFWIKNSSNALSTSIQWLCAASVSLSLTQLIWWFIRRRPFTVVQLNHLFGLPSPFLIIIMGLF